jgi:inorganic pyrophosphatase
MRTPGDYPDVIEVVVEIPRGSRNKYEFDETAGVYRLDRVLSSAVFYNFDYGFVAETRAGDGDHTDALLVIDEPTFTGCHVWARPIGGLEMRDEKGYDFKVLCVALGDPHQQHIEQLDQVRPHRLVEIEQFFATYKALEDKAVDVIGWKDREKALQVLRDDRRTWQREVEAKADVPRAAAASIGIAPTRACPASACSSVCRCRMKRHPRSSRSSSVYGRCRLRRERAMSVGCASTGCT